MSESGPEYGIDYVEFGIVKGPFAFPGGRRFHFADPGGNELAVWSDGGVPLTPPKNVLDDVHKDRLAPDRAVA